MLEGAEKGDELRYAWYFLPIARIAKAFSAVVNIFGMTGPIPEGMSATAALRTQNYMEKHDAIVERLMLKAEEFKTQYGYEPPYWQLVNLSRVAKAELEK
jgi:hypothetical protein